jgi:RNA polymerase sigma factor (sigma-70 family)
MAYDPADRDGGNRRLRATGECAPAFGDIYRQEKPRLLSYFFRKTGNRADADDMVQEAMARFLKIAPLTPITTPRAYLTRIATNLLRDHRERGSTRLSQASQPFEEGLSYASLDNPHRDLEGRQDLERWKQILLKLPSKTLEIFLLNRVEGQSYREIADRFSIPLWMVQKHMLKAIRHIAANQEDGRD